MIGPRNQDIAIRAAAFYFVAEEALNDVEKSDGKSVVENTKIVPAVVNMVFACEIALKSLLPARTNGHKLRELYDRLEPNDQREIRMRVEGEMNYDESTFLTKLDESSNNFVEWRYSYEGYSPNTAHYRMMKLIVQEVLDMYGIDN